MNKENGVDTTAYGSVVQQALTHWNIDGAEARILANEESAVYEIDFDGARYG